MRLFPLCAVTIALALFTTGQLHAAPEAPVPAERLKVLVLDPSSSTVDASVLTTVGSLISVELAKTRQLDVITSSDVKKIAALEAEKQTMGCDEASCLAELAGAMGARLVVFGDANKLGTVTVLTLNLFDSSKATSVGRVSVQAATIEELPAKLPSATRELVRDALQSEGIAVGQGEGAMAVDVRDTAPSPMAGVWTWGLVAGGAVIGIGGLAYDAMAPSSGDDTLDGLDAIGPALMGTGVGVIALAFLVNPFEGGADAK